MARPRRRRGQPIVPHSHKYRLHVLWITSGKGATGEDEEDSSFARAPLAHLHGKAKGQAPERAKRRREEEEESEEAEKVPPSCINLYIYDCFAAQESLRQSRAEQRPANMAKPN